MTDFLVFLTISLPVANLGGFCDSFIEKTDHIIDPFKLYNSMIFQ